MTVSERREIAVGAVWAMLATTLVCLGLILTAANAKAAVIDSKDYGTRLPSNTLGAGKCLLTVFTAATDDAFIFVGGLEVSMLFEADPDGAQVVGNVDVYACTEADDDKDNVKDSTACVPLTLFDTDANNIPDSNRMASTVGQRGTLQAIMVPGWLYYDAIDVTNVPEITTCALAVR